MRLWTIHPMYLDDIGGTTDYENDNLKLHPLFYRVDDEIESWENHI